MSQSVRLNEHGVECRYYGIDDSVGCAPVVCLDCTYFTIEYGEYGSYLTGPYCELWVQLPVRKGSCQRKRAWKPTKADVAMRREPA